MTNDPKDDIALEALFSAARDDEPRLDEAFAARLMPAETAPAALPVQPAPRFRLRDWLPAIGGLGMATAVGVWIGVAVPVDTLLNIDAISSSDALDLSAFYAGADPGVFFTDETGL